ncbi:MAG: hypothetical protein CSA33_06220 [Desulfobulbus propionicus]|nr:MAG: hypothetical protein CSA33_06220 [Desulfobulbus propionicus]
MEKQFKIVSTGVPLAGFSLDDVVDNLVAMTNLNHEKAKTLLCSGKPALIKKNLAPEVAEKYQKKLQQAGLAVQILPQSPPTDPSSTVQGHAKASEQEAPPPPPPETSPRNEKVYSTPKAELKKPQSSSEAWLEEPRKVTAFRGWTWITRAVPLFFAAPWQWIGMSIAALLIIILVSLIPILGPLIQQFVMVLLMAGMLMAAHTLAEGNKFTFAYLFKGFTRNRNQLLLITAIYFGFFIVLACIVGIFFFSMGIFDQMASGVFSSEIMLQIITNHPYIVLLTIGGIALVTIPFFMAYWLTTPLVALPGLKAWPAYAVSLKAYLRNWIPFLVYSIMLAIVGGIVLAILMGLMAVLSGMIAAPVFIIIPLVLLSNTVFIIPLAVIGLLSYYLSFRDIFHAETQ